MKTKRVSKKSSKKVLIEHIGTVTVAAPIQPSPWLKWSDRDIHEIKFAGRKFKVGRLHNSLYVGQALQHGTFGFANADAILDTGLSTSSDSCAYERLKPHGRTEAACLAFAWMLWHTPIPRATLSYLIPADGDVRLLKAILVARGFNLCAINASKHSGSYNVYLFVHPGEGSVVKKRTRKIELFNGEETNDKNIAA